MNYLITFDLMEAKKQLRQRHKEAVAELKKVAAPFINDNSLNQKAKAIEKNLGVSYQTVVNYVYGKTKDGFLTEAITKELQSL